MFLRLFCEGYIPKFIGSWFFMKDACSVNVHDECISAISVSSLGGCAHAELSHIHIVW